MSYLIWKVCTLTVKSRLFTASLFSQIVGAASELELSAKRERGVGGFALAVSVEKIERLWTV